MREICLQHNNARPHAPHATQRVVENFIWLRCFRPTPHSLNLAPKDYHLFKKIKKHQEKMFTLSA